MNKRILTIGRQLGSGGRMLGEKLAERLGISFYDRKLLELVSERSGIPKPELEKQEEKAANPLLYPFPHTYTNIAGYGNSTNDILFNYQAELIQDIAEKEDCVIVGRCADFVLRNHPGRKSVFVYAPLDARVSRIQKRHCATSEEALQLIKKTDKQRRTYYSYYTDRKWGDPNGYDLMLNSSSFDEETILQILFKVFKAAKE